MLYVANIEFTNVTSNVTSNWELAHNIASFVFYCLPDGLTRYFSYCCTYFTFTINAFPVNVETPIKFTIIKKKVSGFS